MTALDHLSDAEVRRFADRLTRMGILPSGFRAPAAPPLVASVGQVGPVSLDFPVAGVPIVFTKNWTARPLRTADVNAGGGNSGSSGLNVPMKAGFLYRVLYCLFLASNTGTVRLVWKGVGAGSGIALTQWTQQDLVGGTYHVAPTDITTIGFSFVAVTVQPDQDTTLGLDFQAEPVGLPNVATVLKGSFADSWRVA